MTLACFQTHIMPLLLDRRMCLLYQEELCTPTFSLQPIGMSAAATLPMPLSVASRLNCAAAFLVSCSSTRIPRLLMYFLVLGASGTMEVPTPRMSKSTQLLVLDHRVAQRQAEVNIPGFGQTSPKTPHDASPTSNWPFLLINLFLPKVSNPHGLHANASPPISNTPAPSVILTPLFR